MIHTVSCSFFLAIMQQPQVSSSDETIIKLYMIPVRGSLPPPPRVWSPKPAFCSIPARKQGVCSVFCIVGGWHGPQTGKFRISATNLPKTSYLQDLCDPSRTEALAMLRLRHRGVVPSHPLLCQVLIQFQIFFFWRSAKSSQPP